MEIETMKFIVKQSIITKNLCRFADDQMRANKQIVKAINHQRKSILCLCAATALLLMAENSSQKRIERLEKEVSRLKNPETDEDIADLDFDVKLL